MKQQRLFILISSCVGAISTFLPWINISVLGNKVHILYGINLPIPSELDDFGRIALISFAVVFFICLMEKPLSVFMIVLFSLIPSGIGIYVINKYHFNILENNTFELRSTTVSVGLYLVILSGVFSSVLALLKNKENTL